MRSPLALLKLLDPRTGKPVWKPVRTERAARGCDAQAAVFLREPTEREKFTIQACCLHSGGPLTGMFP